VNESAPAFFKRGPSALNRLIFFASLSVLTIVADVRFHGLEWVRSGVQVALQPAQQLTALPSQWMFQLQGFLTIQTKLQNEVHQLKQEQLALGAQAQRAQGLQSEIQQMRALLKMRERFEKTPVTAQILFSSPDPFVRKVVIDKGSNEQIQTGQVVVDHIGVIGQITRVYQWMAEVTLLTDKDQSIPIMVVRTGQRGILFGTSLDHSLDLRFMPASSDLQNGDELVTSGIDSIYPAGLPVAKITNIERNAALVFVKVTCQPSSGLNHYANVMVLASQSLLPANPLMQKNEAAPIAANQGRRRLRTILGNE